MEESFCSSASFQFESIESSVSEFWNKNRIYQKAKEKVKNGSPYYFLDGPPYTTGKVHLGTAWNKTMKDLFIRFKRMNGFNIWDRPGYDMHGLPTERATEKAHGIAGREDIEQKVGKEKFIQLCREFCLNNMNEMSRTFKHLGVWMDFDDSYQSLSKEFMEGEWWFIAKAHEKKRLYKGLRTMAWDPITATALSKHELEYRTIVDTAIYVRFRVTNSKDKLKTYFLVWTTTPWTLAFNLVVAVNPKFLYSKVNVVYEGEEQNWYIGKDVVDDLLLKKLNLKGYKVLGNFIGEDLAGMSYEHPFNHLSPIYASLKQQYPSCFTCLADKIANNNGTAILHCAPGCGTEDYEVGYRAGVPAFNTVNESGIIEDFPPFDGLRPRKDDDAFVLKLQQSKALLCSQKIAHEYPHGERSHAPVIFRTTLQWFLKIEDIKERLIEENNKINWYPKTSYNAFSNWLENLRDNSISKQRFWGTPLPIWINIKDEADFIIVSSAKELAELANLSEEPQDLHIDTVDSIVIKRKSPVTGQEVEYRRIKDVLDVWVDAGTTLWNSLRHYSSKSGSVLSEIEFQPAEFILEGRDQIRGWFNLLHVLSVVTFDKPAFKNVFVHGFINNSSGKKMSKSQENYILPEEITKKWGVDVMRFYVIGAANPGQDMNYNAKDVEQMSKSIRIFWNIHRYVIDFRVHHGVKVLPMEKLKDHNLKLETEELFILSSLNTMLRNLTCSINEFRLHDAPCIVSEFLLDLSKTYMQLVWERVSMGAESEKSSVLSVMVHVLVQAFTAFAIIAPFFSEQIYQNLKLACPELSDTELFREESIHLRMWPKVELEYIDPQLEEDFAIAKRAMTAILSTRIKVSIGVRYPVNEIRFSCSDAKERDAITRLSDLIMQRTNAKKISFEGTGIALKVHPNSQLIGKTWGKYTQQITNFIDNNAESLAKSLQMGEEIRLNCVIKRRLDDLQAECDEIECEIELKHLLLDYVTPEPWAHSKDGTIHAFLDTTRTQELDGEGWSRDIMRKVQQLRKKHHLAKNDLIILSISSKNESFINAMESSSAIVLERTGSCKLRLRNTSNGYTFSKGFGRENKDPKYRGDGIFETEKLTGDITVQLKIRVLDNPKL
eukprot:TRINITY_DN6368_c0_g1_i1.p1 TRINITY_DN6368_c0_g1~~TRINITY_DN6368_c0_g1_i1.p1  ORF type:complete len:1114 (+),score=183.90 TRINITY_DN6368_c0_g1_i1:391-3732(+)